MSESDSITDGPAVISASIAWYFLRIGVLGSRCSRVALITLGTVVITTGFPRHSLVDLITVLIALGAFGLTWAWRKIPDPLIIAAAALIGLVVRA